MAQQPNFELPPEELPFENLDTEAARRQVAVAPGTILRPDEKPSGKGFGTPGPDTGWALRILAFADLPEDSPRLRRVLAALMGARAARFGRAPTPGDLEVALLLTGLGRVTNQELDERRARWVTAVAHERSPGRTAVAEAGDVLYESTDRVDLLVRR